MRKRGPWSNRDKEFIESNYTKMDHIGMGDKINRDPEAVLKYLEQNGLVTNKGAITMADEYDIKKTPHWKEIKRQFSEEEQASFIYHWNNIIRQFRDDVLHTEELQIIDMIKLEIIMNRMLSDQQNVAERIKELEEDLRKEKNQDPDHRDVVMMNDLEHQIAQLYGAVESIGKEYRALLTDKNKILDKIKGTREQRIKDIQSSKETLSGWVRQLLADPRLRREMGLRMEKMRLAMEKERERLTEYHTYEDGTIDQPLLTPETTKGGE